MNTKRSVTQSSFTASLLCSTIFFASPFSRAEEASSISPSAVDWLDEITVIAKKSARPIRDVANTVSIIDDERLNESMVQNIRDMMRYEPGVSVSSDSSRFGLNSFTIRGIDGNRVATELDGVPVSDSFKIGSFSNAGRDFVDPEILKRVEVLRGPASTLYGSDALGGVVTFTTKDPLDFLVQSGSDLHLGLKTAYSGDNSSFISTVTSAARLGKFETSLVLSGRQGDETENRAEQVQMRANPANFDSQNIIAKVVYQQAADNQFRLTLDNNETDRFTNVLSLVAGSGQFASTTRLEGDDSSARDRISIDHSFSIVDSVVDKGLWRLYQQKSETTQSSLQDRGPAATPTRRIRSFQFTQDVTGFEVTLESYIEFGKTPHRFVYGLESVQTEVEELRDGVQINLNTGVSTNVVIGEVLPVRDFPNSETQELGAYIQDEISLNNGNTTLITAVRYESYKLNTNPDSIFLNDNPTLALSSLKEDNTSPKIGLLQKVNDEMTVFAQYSKGFRSPPMDDVNIGFTIPLFNYTAIPNPDLKPETSDGIEIGYRYHTDHAALSVAGYYTEYKNLIESRVNLGINPLTGALTFQSQNRNTAEIVGLEYRGNFDISTIISDSGSLVLKTSVAFTKGTDTTRQQPLNSIDPAKAVIGLDYDIENVWGLEVIASHVVAKTDVDETSTTYFKTPGYTIGDILGYYKISKNVKFNIGVFNISDKQYWEWSEARKLAPNDPLLDFYSRAGRYGSVSLNLLW